MRNGDKFICLRYAQIRTRRLLESRSPVLPIRPAITPDRRSGMTGDRAVRILRMRLAEVPSSQYLGCPQTFPCGQIPLDAFFQFAPPNNPMLQLLFAFGLVYAAVRNQFPDQIFQSCQRVILRKTQQRQQFTANRSGNPQRPDQFEKSHFSTLSGTFGLP